MATLTVSHPAVLQFQQPSKEPITQLRLKLVLSLRNRAKQIEAELEKEESALRAMIEAGASVEAGEHTVALQINTRRNVAWKAITMRLAKRLGLDPDAYCSNVLVHTKATKSVSLEIN